MFPLYLQYLLIDFRQTFVTGASRDRNELIRFWGQKVKVQGHTIPAEAHSTRRYRRVQASSATFLVVIYLFPPPKEGGYVFTSVCPFVCPLDYSKSYERILMKFVHGWGVAQRTIE